MFVEDIQFEVYDNKFECQQCEKKIVIPKECCNAMEKNPEGETREISCPKCGTVYIIGKNPDRDGYIVTEKTSSTTELEEIEEQELEDE